MKLTPDQRANLDEFHNVVDFRSKAIPSTRHALRIDVLCVWIGVASFCIFFWIALGVLLASLIH